MIVSLCGLVAAAILLGTVNGKPLSSWAFPIAPNSLLSVFVTMSKTALLLVVSDCISQLKWLYFQHEPHRLHDIHTFNEASRGQWGSLEFLFNVKVKDAFLGFKSGAAPAALGTLITIAALAVDPFAQVLAFPL